MDGGMERGTREQVCLGGPYKAWMKGELRKGNRATAETYTCRRDTVQGEPTYSLFNTFFISHILYNTVGLYYFDNNIIGTLKFTTVSYFHSFVHHFSQFC